VLRRVADITNPKILELGSGRGCRSCKLLDNHSRADVTVTDVDPIVEVPDV
jgi:methylase of polypeptide subunit release factors